jgi:hypothetical protein
VGVATAGEDDKQNVNYAIPLKDLRKAIDKAAANKDKDLDPYSREHDFITVYFRLLTTYQSTIDYVDCLAGSLRGSAARQQELPRLQKAMRTNLLKVKIIDADINLVTSHKTIPESRKQQLRELLSDYNDASQEFGQLLTTNAASDQLEAAAKRRSTRFKAHLNWFVLNLGKDNLR